jgi:hypothetical protein
MVIGEGAAGSYMFSAGACFEALGSARGANENASTGLCLFGTAYIPQRYPNKSLIYALKFLSFRKGLLSPEQLHSLELQMTALLAEGDDGELAAPEVSLLSLDTLIEFLSRYRPRTHPNLAIAKSGLFSASWTHGRRAKITLSFDRDGGEWVGVDLDAKIRNSGAFVRDSLAGIALPYREWITA